MAERGGNLRVMPEAKLMEESARLAQLYGLGIVLAIAIPITTVFLVRWIIKAFNMQLTQNNEREQRYIGVIDGSIKQMNLLLSQHDQRSIDAVRSMQEAQTHQREEHREIMEMARRIYDRSSA